MICFLSYARKDKTHTRGTDDAPYFRTFLEDLNDQLIKVSGDPEALFVDQDGIGNGSVWPAVLANGLRTCSVFAYLRSPFYFQRPDCGKEWTAFWQRMQAAGKVADHPHQLSPMIPISWLPTRFVEKQIPPQVAAIQYTLSGMDSRYAEKGMQHLAKFTSDAAYVNAIERLANHILECAEKVGLAPAPALTDYAAIEPVFPRPALVAAGEPAMPAGPATSGPQYARFIFVAAPPDRLSKLRKDVTAYRPSGADRWKPFSYDEPELNAALIAMNAAIQTKLIFQQATVALDPNEFHEQLQQACRDLTPVVILIDVWTLQLPDYNETLRQFDNTPFFNCVPFMPWNMKDDETVAAQAALRKVVDETFPNLLTNGKFKPNFESITTVDELRKRIEKGLAELKTTIIKKSKPIAFPAGPLVSMPIIPAPGGFF